MGEDMKKVTTEITIRFRDIDAMGHVNNALYLTYFEEGRKAFLAEALGIIHHADYPFILANITCDYLKPIMLEDRVALDVWISETGTRSFTFAYELRGLTESGTVFGRGSSVMVMYDYAGGKTVTIPDDFLVKIREYSD